MSGYSEDLNIDFSDEGSWAHSQKLKITLLFRLGGKFSNMAQLIWIALKWSFNQTLSIFIPFNIEREIRKQHTRNNLNHHKVETNRFTKTWWGAMIQFYSILSRALNRHPHIGLVVTLLVSAHREFQGSQGAQDPQDQLVPQDHPAIMDLKDPWDHEETKVMKVFAENKVSQVHPEKQVLVEARVLKAQRDLKGPQVQQAHQETRVTQALVEAKVLQAPRELQGLWDVTGNSAFLRISVTKGTLDWSR